MTLALSPAVRPLVRHGAEMLVAMLVGMALLGPLWTPDRVELAALWSAVSMSVPMVLWMRYRGHGRVFEMCAAMVVPYLVMLVPYWLGWLDGSAVLMGGHVLMVPAMIVALVRHRPGVPSTSPVVRVLCGHWPAVIALAVTFDFWQEPVFPPAWTLLVVQLVYVLWGRGSRTQLVVFGLYGLLAVAAMLVAPFYGVALVVFGWAAHAVWDFVHHVRDAVVPRWWSEFCGVFDLVVAVSILLVWPLP